jgi:hypothetical protein
MARKSREIVEAMSGVLDSEFETLMRTADFSLIEIDSEPNHWRLDLCNAVIGRLVNQNIKITPEFSCYSKNSREKRQRVRVFYDKTQHVAIGICFVSSKVGPG